MGALVEDARAVARREVSSRELVEAALRAADRLQPTLNAFTMLFEEHSLLDAASADDAPARGPLHGVPVAVKDAYDVAGAVTSACCRAYSGRVADRDSGAVAALRRAGAIVIGKTNMHELAFGDTTAVSSYGRANNPWDPERVPGGSSGGSGAAVAARIVPLALAEDTGGSIRTPAAVCGVTGLKPTFGVVPTDGIVPLSPSLDTAGPITVDADDVALAFAALAPFVSDERETLDGVRIGIPEGYYFRVVDEEVESLVRSAGEELSRCGAKISSIDIEGLDSANDHWIKVALFEFAREHGALLDRLGEVDPTIGALLQMSARIPESDYSNALEGAKRFASQFESAFREVDVLLAPATPIPAPRHDQDMIAVRGTELSTRAGALSMQAFPASLAGVPALVAPCGFAKEGLPIGMQLIGPRDGEPLLIAVAHVYQRETDWHTRVPPISAVT
jgi:aspartyl-tRNA(Asn)/glutamyl-tRNA(Gln) amidotransferase subunit A